MRRIATLAALIASGCTTESQPPAYPYGDVAVHWNFPRHTLVAPFSVIYDQDVNPGGASGACSESGVEYVTVTDASGVLIDPGRPTIPCVSDGVQGAPFFDFAPGSYALVIHGYRTLNAGPVEVHRGQVSVQVQAGTLSPVTIAAPGVQGDLDVFLYDGASLFSCAAGDTLGYTLQDGRPGATVIDQAWGLPCQNPIEFRLASSKGVDLDVLDIRVQVSRGGSVALDSCGSQPFVHAARDTGVASGWPVSLFASCG